MTDKQVIDEYRDIIDDFKVGIKQKNAEIRSLKRCLENIISLKGKAQKTEDLYEVLQAIDAAKELL